MTRSEDALRSTAPVAWTPEGASIGTRISERAAEQRLQRLLDLQSLSARIAREIGPATDLHVVLKSVLRGMRSLMEFKGGTICLVEEGAVRIAASDPPVSPDVMALRLPVGSGLAGRCIATGEPIYSPDLDADPRVDQAVRKLGSNATMKSYLAVPLVCLGEVIGLMQVDSTRAHAYDEDDVRMLEGLAVHVAGAIESARRYEEIVRLEQLKSDFIARVSHELRTPLTIVVGGVPLLRDYGERMDPADRAQLLDRMKANADRLRDLIEELLSVTSYEAGMDRAHLTDVELREVLARAAEETGDPERVDVRCDDGLTIVVDPKLLKHALSLVVDNALKYAGHAGIEGHATEDGAIVIDVTDDGPGIPPAMRDQIFQRFVRGDDRQPGLGLGLPLARTLVSGFRGRLELVDQPEGARFRITIPTQQAD